MKKIMLPIFAAVVTVACNNDKKATDTTDTTTQTTSSTEANTENTGTKVEDGPAIATIETDDYILKVHKAIPFTPDDTKTAGAFKPKEGNQFIALDISVKSKSNQPLEMGSVMLATEITDEKGTKFGGTVPVLTSYSLTFPDPNYQNEYDALWSEEYGAGQFHRTTALGFEAPKDIKTFIISAPVKAYSTEKKKAQFSL